MGSFSKIQTIFENCQSFLLISHEQPDGDSLGSLLALGEALKLRGKDVILVCPDPVPDIFSFLEGSSGIKRDFLAGNFDAVILLDNGDARRTGFSERLKQFQQKKIPIVNIDHHPKNDLWKTASVNYVDEGISSSSELVYKILFGLKWEINRTIATNLLTGIYTDTGGFQHPNTSEKVYRVVSELLLKGAKLKTISEKISNFHSVSRLKLWGIALNRLIINKKMGIVSSVLLRSDIEKANASDDEVSGLVNLINSIPESKVALLLYEASDGKIRGSLRTDNDVDVSKLAKLLGGGGHKKAAGFSINGQLVEMDDKWCII